MATTKMRYGIDLGTTNSSICRMENGEPTVKKTDTLKDTLPSCVSFSKKKIVKVGDSAFNDLRSDKSRATKNWSNSKENVFIEFKRTMGLDKEYQSSNMERGFSSEELSAEVLKSLKSYISDENVNSAVITIPAKFKSDQIAATKRAASMAGIEYCQLLQEPIAASMAYGLNSKNKNGTWLVFDFGGGTFDAALIKVEDGVMMVKDTDGDNYLGGKNLDYAIVDELIIPNLKNEFALDGILADEKKRSILRDAMKFYAEQAKNQLSFKDEADLTSQLDEFGLDDDDMDIELDMVITQDDLVSVLSPIFQKAIDITKNLLQRNNLNGSDLDKLILVGGPTHSPILRQMLKDQLTKNVDTSIDPMMAVALGASLFASGLDDEVQQEVESGTVALDITYTSNSVEEVEFVAVKTNPDESKGEVPSKVYVELARNDKDWSNGKVLIDDCGDVIECQLKKGRANSFKVMAFDDKGSPISCFPNEITIMQGIVVGNAVLPYHIGVEVHNDELFKDVFVPLKGLEKNQSIPAVGVRNGLRNPKQLRPGVEEDRLIIPIYQGEHNAEGTSAIYNDHVFDVIITGEDVPNLVPANSEIDITIKVDASQMMKLEAYFPVIGDTVEKDINVQQRSGVDIDSLAKNVDAASNKLRALEKTDSISKEELKEARETLSNIKTRFASEKGNEDGKMHLLADTRRVFLAMEKVENAHEWDSLESELRSEFERLENANDDLGHKHDQKVESLRSQVDMVISQRNVNLARSTLKDLEQVFIEVTAVYQIINFIRFLSENFDSLKWKDSDRAFQLVNRAQQILENDRTSPELIAILPELAKLVDEDVGEKIKF